MLRSGLGVIGIGETLRIWLDLPVRQLSRGEHSVFPGNSEGLRRQ